MYIIKNAIKNIGRNKGRNILMAVIIFAILLTSVVSIMINNTTEKIIEDYKARFGSEVFIDIDWGKWQSMDNQDNVKWTTPSQEIGFGESDLLKGADYQANMYAVLEDIKTQDEDPTDSNSGGMASGQMTSPTGEETVEPNAMLIGYDNPLNMKEFKNETRKITEGRVYKEINECIISQQLAERNNLSLNDKIKVDSYLKNRPMTIEVTIVGIFEDNTMAGNKISYSPADRNNEVLVNLDTALNSEAVEELGYVDSTFYLNTPDDLEAFTAELRSKGLSDVYKVSVDEASYKKVVAPVEGITKITNTFLYVVLVLGSLVLIILSTLAIRERKYEVGVLRAMGMKKRNVALGLLSETIIITVICLVLGIGIGSMAAQPIADSLLKDQIQIAEENSNTGMGVSADSYSSNRNTDVTALTEVTIHLNMKTVEQIAAISLLLAVMSSLAGILYITKYEPMKILSERN